MNTISPVFIHQPDSCHGWGIEFNKERPFWEADATAFVRAMYDEMQSHDKSFSWFHQCGSGQEQNGNYYGYQFFYAGGSDFFLAKTDASSFVTVSMATAALGKVILSVGLLPIWKLPTVSEST